MRTNLPRFSPSGTWWTTRGSWTSSPLGFAEAAVAVSQAVRFVDPEARVNPGHSTNLKIFKDLLTRYQPS